MASFDWEFKIEGQTFSSLNLREYVVQASIEHKVPKSTGKRKLKASRNPGHTASITMMNPNLVLNGLFRQLDKMELWLGTNDQMYYQGKYRIKSADYTGSGTQKDRVELKLVCVSYDASRRYTVKNYEGKSPAEIVELVATENGWNVETDLDTELKIDLVKTAYESDWDIICTIADDSGGLDVFLDYPQDVEFSEDPKPTLKVKKERYDQVLGSDGKPFTLYYEGAGPEANRFNTYSASTGDTKQSGRKSGTVNKNGVPEDTYKRDAYDTLEKGVKTQRIYSENPADACMTEAEICGGEPGPTPMVSKGPISSKSSKALQTKTDGIIESSNKASLNITPDNPMPFLAVRQKIGIVGLSTFDGDWSLKVVKHSFSGTQWLRTELTFDKKSVDTKKDSSDKGGKNNQEASKGDKTYNTLEAGVKLTRLVEA